MFHILELKLYACAYLFFIIIALHACTKITDTKALNDEQESSLIFSAKKNIIIILEDDIGYEIPSYTGGRSYNTPQMDLLSKKGMKFTHCFSSALCSPSRIMLLTGKYGFRNYQDWGILNTAQKTIANMLHDDGYATCVTGKWQLDGGSASISKFGFDEHCVFDPFTEKDSLASDEDRHRYKNPTLYQNGAYLPASKTNGKFSDDMFASYATDFIERNKSRGFFLYFSFSECHVPFFPPPNHPRYASYDPLTATGSPDYFPYMVSYMDSKINTIIQKVTDAGLLNKTYIFILADNGTPKAITSWYNNRLITGGKNSTNDFGLHVPLIVLGPAVKTGSTNKNIVDFTDLMPTIANIAQIPKANLGKYGIMDGKSFFDQLADPTKIGRTYSYGYFFPFPSYKAQQRVYVQDTAYKLYDATNSNNFYNIQKDSLEQFPIPDIKLTAKEKQTKTNFQTILLTMHN
jgi:arylsulfatase A